LSVDRGRSNLGTFNNPTKGGDAADWTPTVKGDAFGSGYSATTSSVSPTDIIVTSLAGYTMTPAAVTATKTPGLA
jgi:hypothetical protein